MGRADYWASGDANGICDRCGFKFKMSELAREWTGLFVCGPNGNDCYEERNAQDRLRTIQDRQAVPNARPQQDPEFIP